MKLRTSILAFLFIGLFSAGSYAQTVESDYEIQKSFKEQYANFQERIDTVSSPDTVQALIDSIKTFEQKYSQHAELLDKVLHPDTYKERMEDLKSYSVKAMKRLNTIEQQTQKLEKLETQLTGYEDKMQQLNRRTDSLKTAMDKSIQSEKRLSGMLREYRQSLEKRDELILAFIDSMVVAYQQMELESLKDLENIEQRSRLESDADALKMIHNISTENLEILEKNSDKLHLEDFMRMGAVQEEFEKMWNQLGTKITEVYAGENAEQIAGEVEQNISRWNEMVEKQAFAALRDTLAQNEIQVGGFDSPDQLYSSLNSYLDKQIQQSREDASEAGYQNFKQFQRFWNQVELQWSSNFVDAGLLDKKQMATLSQKVDTWAENAQPESGNLLVWLFGASVLIAVALGVLLIREKKGKSQP